MPTRKTKKGRVGPRRTRVRDHLGLWGDHRIGADCTIARSVETCDGVRVGDRCQVEAVASPPPGAVLEDDVFVPTRASPTTGGRGRGGERERVVRRGASIGTETDLDRTGVVHRRAHAPRKMYKAEACISSSTVGGREP
jgi:hypothetical protein